MMSKSTYFNPSDWILRCQRFHVRNKEFTIQYLSQKHLFWSWYGLDSGCQRFNLSNNEFYKQMFIPEARILSCMVSHESILTLLKKKLTKRKL